MDKLASANIALTESESISLDLIKQGVKLYNGKESNSNRSSDPRYL